MSYSSKRARYTTPIWLYRVVVALYVVVPLLPVVGLILTMTTSEWLYVVSCVINAIALYLAGLLLLGYVGLRITLTILLGKDD